MANTTVRLRFGVESILPDIKEVSVVLGDTVTFQNDADLGATLFFNSEASAILSPASGEDGASVPAGESAVFTFTSSDAGHYAALVQMAGLPAPPSSNPTQPPSAVLRISDAKSGWPSDGTQESGSTGG